MFLVTVHRFDRTLESRGGALRVDGADRSDLVHRAREQARAVERLVAPTVPKPVEVVPVLVFLDMGRTLRWDAPSSCVVPLRRLRRTVAAPQRLPRSLVGELAAAVPDRLPR